MRPSIAIARLWIALLLAATACVQEPPKRSPAEDAEQESTRASSAQLSEESARPSVPSPRGLAVLREVNLARTDPRGYAEIIRSWLPAYEGLILHLPGDRNLMTTEGAAAAREAIRVLQTTLPVGPLHPSEGMSRGAQDLVLDQKESGSVGHQGRHGDEVSDRVNRYGEWDRSVSENICYGFDDPREIVVSLLIDDAVPNRGHRRNIYDPEFQIAGVALGPHPVYRSMCVMTLAAAYREWPH